ncbi:hypothetical protein SGLAM104S_09507 [Streptomyces glaucescens]
MAVPVTASTSGPRGWRQLAVGEQVVVGLVPADQLGLAVGGDQAEERLGGEESGGGRSAGACAAGGGGARRRRRGAGRPRRRRAGAAGPRPRARGHAEQTGVGAARGEVAVADVVDEAGEAVDRPSGRRARRGAGRRGPPGSSRTRLCRAWRAPGRPGAPCGFPSPCTASGGTAHAAGSRGVSVAIAVTSPVLHCRPNSHYFGHAARRSHGPLVPVEGAAHYRHTCRDSAPVELTLYNAGGSVGVSRASQEHTDWPQDSYV